MNTVQLTPTLVQRPPLAFPPKQDAALEFQFAAIQADRSLKRGLIKAHSRRSAQEQLLLRYAHLLSLEEVVPQQSALQALADYRHRNESLPAYTRSIAVMFGAGLPLVRIFETVAQGEDAYLNKVMLDVAESLRRGRTLSNSLARWGSVFDQTYVGMVYSAEQSGRLHKTFAQLADLLERRWKVERQVRSALTYPTVLAVVALGIFWLLLAFVVPQLIPSFASIGAELPLITQVLVTIGSFSTSVPMVLGTLLTLVGIVGIAYRTVVQGQRFTKLAQLLDRAKFSTPIFGQLFQLAALSRTLSTMSAMLAAGLGLGKVLSIGGRISGSAQYEEEFKSILQQVKNGESLGSAMETSPLFPPLVVGMAQLGEEAGKLPYLLSKIAALYEEDLDRRVTALATLVEPVMMAILGAVVGFIVLGTFLPMINLIQQL